MADIDIFNPKVSKVIAGTQNKCFLIHSEERKLGKTTQACRMPKPYYLRFEQGINAIEGIPYADLSNWADFKKVNKQLTDPKNAEKIAELYQTIIFDTIDVAIKWCEEYVCNTNGIQKLQELPYGQGFKAYENEWFKQINKLTNAGFTIVFISHSKEKEKTDPVTGESYTQMCPVGGSKDIDLILNLVDFIGYVRSNGLDSEGNEIQSSIYFANTRDFQAGSRFKYMPKVITPFTAENLQKAVKEAVEKEEAEKGIKAISFEEKKKMEKKDKIPFNTLMEKVQEVGEKIVNAGFLDDLVSIVEEELGSGKKVSECKPKQYDAVSVIYDNLCEKWKEIEENTNVDNKE